MELILSDIQADQSIPDHGRLVDIAGRFRRRPGLNTVVENFEQKCCAILALGTLHLRLRERSPETTKDRGNRNQACWELSDGWIW
jgi:hypothetical protein